MASIPGKLLMAIVGIAVSIAAVGDASTQPVTQPTFESFIQAVDRQFPSRTSLREWFLCEITSDSFSARYVVSMRAGATEVQVSTWQITDDSQFEAIRSGLTIPEVENLLRGTLRNVWIFSLSGFLYVALPPGGKTEHGRAAYHTDTTANDQGDMNYVLSHSRRVATPAGAFFGQVSHRDSPSLAEMMRAGEKRTVQRVDVDGAPRWVVGFSVPQGTFTMTFAVDASLTLVDWELRRSATDLAFDRPLWRILRSPPLLATSTEAPSRADLGVSEHIVAKLASPEVGARTFPTDHVTTVCRIRDQLGKTTETRNSAWWLGSSPHQSSTDLVLEVEGWLPEGLEVGVFIDGKSDGLYRIWKDGKPTVVERPKVEETLDNAVKQLTTRPTSPPESTNPMVWILFGSFAVLVAAVIALLLQKRTARI